MDSAPARTLSIVVPCVDAAGLGQKLTDLRKLDPWTAEVVIAFNGREADYAAVAELPKRLGLERCVVERSEPFLKARAMSQALARVRTGRVLYSDADCLIRGEPNLSELARAIESEDVVSFAVLRRPKISTRRVRAVLFRRRLMDRLYRMLGLYYLAVRGGGYLAGNLGECLAQGPYSDDLLCPAEYAARRGVRISVSDALVFYEATGSSGYSRKIPRLVYGSIQAIRLSRSRRVKVSLAIEKLGKYLLVGFSPALAIGVLYLLSWPLWLGLLLLPLVPRIARAWQGAYHGLADIPPGW